MSDVNYENEVQKYLDTISGLGTSGNYYFNVMTSSHETQFEFLSNLMCLGVRAPDERTAKIMLFFLQRIYDREDRKTYPDIIGDMREVFYNEKDDYESFKEMMEPESGFEFFGYFEDVKEFKTKKELLKGKKKEHERYLKFLKEKKKDLMDGRTDLYVLNIWTGKRIAREITRRKNLGEKK